MIISKFYYFLVVGILSSITLQADPIKIHNKEKKEVYAQFYYTKGTISQPLSATPLRIPPGDFVTVERPQSKLYLGGVYDRDLYFSYSKENDNDFPPLITKGTRRFVNVGDSRGNEFFIAENTAGELDGYNIVSWNARPLKEIALTAIYEQVRKYYDQRPYMQTDSQLRIGRDLCTEEKAFIRNRFSRAKNTLEKILGIQLTDNQVPRIAVCGSGGGYRAMIYTAGFLSGMESLGVLDSVLYAAGLSGSTWALAGWTQSGKNAADFLTDLSMKLQVDIKDKVNSTQVSGLLIRNLAFNQPISLINVWGSLIAQKVLAGMGEADPNNYTLSGLIHKISRAEKPFPLFVALSSQRGIPYEWTEFTPYEVGSAGAYVPSWAFGRKFEAGKSSKQGFSSYPPEQSLGFCMGIWGSAMSVNAQDLANQKYWGQSGIDAKITNIILDQLKGSVVTEGRFLPAEVYNWTYKSPNLPLNELTTLHLVDAAMVCNIPLPPLLRTERSVDIIIICDSSGDVVKNPANELRKAEAYARQKQLPFPKIDYEAAKKSFSIHYGDPQKGIPTIIYVPYASNPDYLKGWFLDPAAANNPYTATVNCQYSTAQVTELSGLSKFNIVANKQNIIDAIKTVAIAKGAQL